MKGYVLAMLVLGATSAAAPAATLRHLPHRRDRVRAPAAQPQKRRAHAAIIGGLEAAAGTFPWMAFIVDEHAGYFDLCSGTVVSPNVVLTAGHCVENEETGTVNAPGDYAVVTGNVDWHGTPRQVSGVSRVIPDAGYLRTFGVGDAGLLELSTPTTAPAIQLATWPSDEHVIEGGDLAVVAGWGKTFPEEEGLPLQLRWAETVIQRPRYCEEEAPTFFPSEELCAIDPPSFSTGTCFGDSGGPLIGPNPEGSGVVEIGLTSHGYGECSTERPSVFTRADWVASWVHSWVELLKPPPPPPPSAPVSPPPAPAPAAPAPVVPAPSPALPPLPNTPGYYMTRASKLRKIVIHVSGDGQHVVGMHIMMPVNCQHRYETGFNDSWLSYRESVPIEGHVVRTTLEWPPSRETKRGTIGVYLDFTAAGLVEGRLRVHLPYKSRRYGLCAGTLNFTAKT